MTAPGDDFNFDDFNFDEFLNTCFREDSPDEPIAADKASGTSD